MGGHSKGGNLALYAGCTINEELLDCVEKIYDLDGPGLSVDVMGEPVKKAVLDKTTRILPEFSVVGRIFFDEIFEALSSGGSTTLAELVGEGFEGFKRIQSRLKNCSEVTKRVMYEFMRQAFLGPFLQMHKGTKEDE